MVEILKKHTINHVAARRRASIYEIGELIESLETEGIEKDEIFRVLMNGYGAPPSHISGKEEGKIKEKGRFVVLGRRVINRFSRKGKP